MESILFCSVGRRVKLLEGFKETLRGRYKMIVTENSNIAPAVYLADKVYILPKITDKNYMDKIIEICKKENVKAILTLIDPEIELLAKNEGKLKEIGVLPLIPDYRSAMLCFDKYDMYKYLLKHNIKTTLTYGSIKEFKVAYEENRIHFPVFVKPRKGSGSNGAKKIGNMTELEEIVKKDNSLIIQEFMDGIDIDADVYIDTISNEVINIFSKRKIETKIGGASKTISFKDQKLYDFINEIIKIFKFNGAVDMDFFYQDGEYYLSEINPRFGGAYIHAYAANVNFIENIINNVNKKANKINIGNYEEDIIMMMYDDIIIKKKIELI